MIIHIIVLTYFEWGHNPNPAPTTLLSSKHPTPPGCITNNPILVLISIPLCARQTCPLVIPQPPNPIPTSSLPHTALPVPYLAVFLPLH